MSTRLLTFNVKQFPLLSYVDGSRHRAMAAADLVLRINPDVVVLNEAMGCTPAAALVRRLRTYGYQATPPNGSWRRRGEWDSRDGRWHPLSGLVGGGVTVLSRRPILRQHDHVYRAFQPRTQDALAHKGFVLIEIAGPDGRYWLAATHLQADEPGTHPATHRVRMTQLRELRQVVTRLVPATEPALIAGDLNVESPGGDSLPEAENAVGGRIRPDGPLHAPTFDGRRNTLAAKEDSAYHTVLDYVGFLNDTGLRPRPRITTDTVYYTDESEASDHFPVLAEVRW
jgi:endonuclease/exonuclease/phosphatase family metal-dependent hydrolase